MIRIELSGNPLDHKQSAPHLLQEVMREIAPTGRSSCLVEIIFAYAPKAAPLRFRISYVGPSRRQALRPSMTANRSK